MPYLHVAFKTTAIAMIDCISYYVVTCIPDSRLCSWSTLTESSPLDRKRHSQDGCIIRQIKVRVLDKIESSFGAIFSSRR